MKHWIVFFWLSVWHLSAQEHQKATSSFDDYFYNAMTERLKSNYQQSNDLFEQCLSLDAGNDAVYFKIAQNYFDLKDYDKSLTYLKQAQKYNPANKWYQKLLIDIKIKQQTNPKTLYKLIKDFEAKAHNKYLVQDLIRQVQSMQIRKRAQPKVTFDPVHSQSDRLEKLWQQKNYQKLIQEAEKALEQQPDDAKIYWYMAKAHAALKQYRDALDYLDMGMDFVAGDKQLLKRYYQQYIIVFTGLKQTGKADKYRQKLEKL